MKEREKMLRGLLYNPMDEELVKLRINARDIAKIYNQTDEDQEDLRDRLLGNLLGSYGENSHISPYVKFDYGVNTYIGNNCYFNFNTTFLDCGEIRIGNNVYVGPNCSFYTPSHPLLAEERNQRRDQDGNWYNLERAMAIVVEDNVWLGGSVVINPGVTICHDSVIAAGSVVVKDLPAGVFAGGNPCQVIRKITEEDRLIK